MAASVAGVTPSPADQAQSGTATASAARETNQEITKEMFLKLLVAQLKNQDPLNPINGTEYLTQLAQFTNLEQMMALRKEVEAIREFVAAGAGQPGSDGAQTEEVPTD